MLTGKIFGLKTRLKLSFEALQKQNVQLERQFRLHLLKSNKKNQYDRRECLEVRGIPQPAEPLEDNINAIVKNVGKLASISRLAISQLVIECPKASLTKGRKSALLQL